MSAAQSLDLNGESRIRFQLRGCLPNTATNQLYGSPYLQGMLSRISAKTSRVLAVVFLLTTLGLGGVLGWTWFSIRKLALAPIPDPALPAKMRPTTAPVSPLQLQYQLNLPGRGEIFPALAGGKAVDYWPVAVLSIANTSSRPVLQVITAQVNGWTEELRETAVIGPNEVRTFNLDPQLLPDAYQNEEIRQASLTVEVKEPVSGHNFAEQRPVFVHSASDLFWGGKFANAQLVARWVTPHDPACPSACFSRGENHPRWPPAWIQWRYPPPN